MNRTTDTYDPSKLVNATFAFENGMHAYGGYVIDLGDGTCKLANSPLLGDTGPKYGDRVDLFYNPCDPFSKPYIGYRIYPEDTKVPGRHFGTRTEPTQEELKEREVQKKLREDRECRAIEENYARLNAPFEISKAQLETSKEFLRYCELSNWIKEQGVQVPDDLHETRKERREPTLEERKDTKLMFLSVAYSEYGDIEVTKEEIQQRIEQDKE